MKIQHKTGPTQTAFFLEIEWVVEGNAFQWLVKQVRGTEGVERCELLGKSAGVLIIADKSQSDRLSGLVNEAKILGEEDLRHVRNAISRVEQALRETR